MEYFIRTKSGDRGPITVEQVQSLVDSGKLKLSHFLKSETGETLTVEEVLTPSDPAAPATPPPAESSDKPEEKKKTSPRKIAGGALLLLLAFGVIHCNKYLNSRKVEKEIMAEVLPMLPGYSENRAYYKELVERCHGEAFDSSYTAGRRRRASEFNQDRYLQILVRKMADEATRDGKREIGKVLRATASRIYENKIRQSDLNRAAGR